MNEDRYQDIVRRVLRPGDVDDDEAIEKLSKLTYASLQDQDRRIATLDARMQAVETKLAAQEQYVRDTFGFVLAALTDLAALKAK